MKKLIDTHWKFDASVAGRFQREAEQHIPDYHKVITLCLTYTNNFFQSKNIRILDVGSALGQTVKVFIDNGYTNVYGVEKSIEMINKSEYSENIIHSNVMPDGPWDVVFANWTLHFINDRDTYIQQIYDNMSSNGMLILSDKTTSNEHIMSLYHDFKRRNGVADETIAQKAESLKGVLTTKPLAWYIDTLSRIGFNEIQVVNASYMFNTIYCRK